MFNATTLLKITILGTVLFLAGSVFNGFMDEQYGFIDEPIYRDALLILNNQ